MKRKGEGSKPPKPKKNKVDPLQQSLLSFSQPLDGSRREGQQEELENDRENTDDDFDMVQQDKEDNGTQQETADTPLTTVDSNRERNPARKRKRKRRRKRPSPGPPTARILNGGRDRQVPLLQGTGF